MVGLLWGRGARREKPVETPAVSAPVIPAAPVAIHEAGPRRDKQLNVKVSQECRDVFAAIAETQGMSAAALFEDMVVERYEVLIGQGLMQRR